MKAAILHAPRDLRVEAAREPRPEPGDVVVRIVAAGLCGTGETRRLDDRQYRRGCNRDAENVALPHTHVLIELPSQFDRKLYLPFGYLRRCRKLAGR